MREEATKLIKNNKIIEILSEVGDISSCGSYKHDLMYDPDIDFAVKSDNPRESSLKALNLFLENKHFQKFEYGDFIDFPRLKRPSGYIICLRKIVNNISWELEIWFLSDDKPDCLDGIEISNSKKLEILQAKHDRSIKGDSKHNLSSYDIYKKTLDIE